MAIRLPSSLLKSAGFLVAKRLAEEFKQDKLSHVSAGIAFYGLLALFPGITAALSLVVLLIEPEVILSELDGYANILPAEAEAIVMAQAEAVTEKGETRLGLRFLLGLALAFWASTKGMQALIDGLNMAHNEKETRGFLHLLALRIGLTFLLIAGLLMGVGMAVIVPATLAALGIAGDSDAWVTSLRWPVMGILTIIGLRLIYRLAPDHRVPNPNLMTWGTVFAAVTWVIASLGFSFYVSNFGSYNETFGTLGGVIVLLMWLWISGLVILIGAEIDAMLEERNAAPPTPSL